jgi:hypothetical protein
MALIRKKLTNPLLVANRANSRESTGPQSELGKRHSSQNGGKHLVYARVSAASMKELGENPADFNKLRNFLRSALAPRDEFEQMLVEDMAELRWRRGRLLRAEAGIVASQKRRFELDHEWGLASRGKGPGARLEDETIRKIGLIGQDDCHAKYYEILAELKGLRALVQTEGFVALGLELLDGLYGKTPGLNGLLLRVYFQRYQEEQEAGDGALQERNRGSFVKRLDPEIESFERLAQLNQERDERLTEPMKDAQLLPGQQDLEKIMRYEAALERHFERKLQQLVSWRREKREGGEKEAPQGPAGGQDEVLQ